MALIFTDGNRSQSRKSAVTRYLSRICAVFQRGGVDFLTKSHIRSDAAAIVNKMPSLKTEDSKANAVRVMY